MTDELIRGSGTVSSTLYHDLALLHGSSRVDIVTISAFGGSELIVKAINSSVEAQNDACNVFSEQIVVESPT